MADDLETKHRLETEHSLNIEPSLDVSSSEGWVKTTCAYCGVGCGVEARPLSNGELEIRGDRTHPANYGKLCTKGIALGKTVSHEGRLLAPMFNRKLDNPKLDTDQSHFEPRFNTKQTRTEQSWDEALSHVAKEFRQTIEEYGPDSVAFYVSGQLLTEDYYLANKLMKGFIGSANIDSNSRLCMASSVVGHKRAFGTDTVPVCYEDIELAEVVVIVGSNLAWCHPVLFQRLREAKQNNPEMKVVVIDPRKTDTSVIADLHLSIQSGSDVALFNGLLAYLADNNAIDHEFVEQHTEGFTHSVLSAQLEDDIAKTTGLTPTELDQFYRLFANNDKVVTIYSQGVNQSTQGADKVNSILNCHLTTGKIGREGCGPFSVTGQPNAMGGREVGALANTLASHLEFQNLEHGKWLSEFWQTNSLAKQEGLKAVDLFDAMHSGKIKAVWIMATNPAVSLPNSQKVKEALEACPFVVVSDCISETETTQYADVLLPAQGWSEKSGTVTNSERRISRQRRLLPSPGLAKPDWWIISQVAQRMGFGEAFDYVHEGEVFAEYAKLSAEANQRFNLDLNLSGLAHLSDMDYNRLTPQQWPISAPQKRLVAQRFFDNGHFYTPNGKANLIPVSYSQPQSSVTNELPLLLNTGRTRDHWHTMTRTGLAAQLCEHSPEPYVLVHPSTAAAYRLAVNKLAAISNPYGKVFARVKISEDMAKNQIFMPIHWNGSTAKQSKVCDLIAPYTDAKSGQPEFKHTPVSIAPAVMPHQGLILSRQPFSSLDFEYWAMQKIDNGYLYRMESSESLSQLENRVQALVSQSGSVDTRTLAYQTSEGFEVSVLSGKRVETMIWIGQVIEQDELEVMVAGKIAQFERLPEESAVQVVEP